MYCIVPHDLGSSDVYIPGPAAPIYKDFHVYLLLSSLYKLLPTYTHPGEYARAFPVVLPPVVGPSPTGFNRL